MRQRSAVVSLLAGFALTSRPLSAAAWQRHAGLRSLDQPRARELASSAGEQGATAHGGLLADAEPSDLPAADDTRKGRLVSARTVPSDDEPPGLPSAYKPRPTAAEAALHAAVRAHSDALTGPFADPQALVGGALAAAREHAIGGFPFLLLLGTSKGGSTFLFGCMQAAFHPRVVCGTDDAAAWSRERCGGTRRFALPALKVRLCASRGPRPHMRVELPPGPLSLQLHAIKENYVLTRGMYRGPTVEPERARLYRGPVLPLELWEARNQRVHTDQPTVQRWLDVVLRQCAESIGGGETCPVRTFRDVGAPYAWHGLASAREGEACGVVRARPLADEAHRNASVGRLCAHRGPGYAQRVFADARAFAAPPIGDAPAARPWESRVWSMDGCPYNLGSAQAPTLLRGMLASRSAARSIRFVVLLRDPVDRAFSEWAMTHRWGGLMHAAGGFEAHARAQVAELGACTRRRGVGLDALVRGEPVDGAQFARVYEHCVDASFYSYIKNSLYGLHLRSWLRHFGAESFLLLRTDAMAKMPPERLLGAIARFAGLHFDAASALSRGPFARAVNRSCSPQPHSPTAPDLRADGSTATPVSASTRAWLRTVFFAGETAWMHMIPPPQLRAAAARIEPRELWVWHHSPT